MNDYLHGCCILGAEVVDELPGSQSEIDVVLGEVDNVIGGGGHHHGGGGGGFGGWPRGNPVFWPGYAEYYDIVEIPVLDEDDLPRDDFDEDTLRRTRNTRRGA